MNPMSCESQARSIKKQIAEWLRDFRRETYGEDGAERLAAMLGVPSRTLLNYETGCTIPAEILVLLLEISDIHPHWLATGQGPKYLPWLGAGQGPRHFPDHRDPASFDRYTTS